MAKILIIGVGPWSSKLAKALSLEAGLEIKRIGARDFISNASNSNLRTVDMIWICSTPAMQIMILGLLVTLRSNCKIIIEKPYFTDIQEMTMLICTVEPILGRIHLSEPWTFSRVWESFKQDILCESKNQLIEITRGGPKTSHRFIAPQDWLPHDINLLSSLSRVTGHKLNFSNARWGKNNENLSVSADLGEKIRIELNGGLYESKRVANWIIKLGLDKTVQLNFNRMTIVETLKGSSQITFQDNPVDQPLVNMATDILNSSAIATTLQGISMHEILLPH